MIGSSFPHRLFLASGSSSRKKLLTDAGFDIVVINQTFDEHSECWNCTPQELVLKLASSKMDHVIMPDPTLLSTKEKNEGIFVLTADTVVIGSDGHIYGKPDNHQEAVETLQKLRTGSSCMSAFCVERRRFDGQQWIPVGMRQCNVDAAGVHFEIEDEWIENYLAMHPIAYHCAGSMAIEGRGALFLRGLEGSYATVIGLPLYQLRHALHALNFFC